MSVHLCNFFFSQNQLHYIASLHDILEQGLIGSSNASHQELKIVSWSGNELSLYFHNIILV